MQLVLVTGLLVLCMATADPYLDVLGEMLAEMRAGVNSTREGVVGLQLQFSRIQDALVAINGNVIWMNQQLDKNAQTVADAMRSLYPVLLAIAILLCSINISILATRCSWKRRSKRPVGFVQELTDVARE